MEKLKKDVAYYMRRLYNKGLTTTSGGNVSALSEKGVVYITPSQTDKGRICSGEIAEMTLKGEMLSASLKPSMETGMHLQIYEARSDIKAIVHAHPVYATAYSITEKEINCNLSGEARAVIGDLQYAEYELMGTKYLAKAVARALSNGSVVLMKNHGVVAVGENLLQAFDRLEVLEATAKISFITEMLGSRNELSRAQVQEIERLMGR